MTKGESKLIIEVTDIEWDAPKSVKCEFPQSFVFHLGTEDEGIDCSDEEEIHECVSDKLSDETGYCHFGFSFQQIQQQ